MRAGFEVFRAFEQVVFVATDEANVFAMLQSILGQREWSTPLIEGFECRGNEITTGSFMLRAEWLKSHPSRG
jgi:hypothetical protein